MTVAISPTLDDVFTAVRAFLIDVLGTGPEIFQAQANRAPEPKAEDFVSMTPLRFPRLGTNVEGLDDTGLQALLMQPAEFVMQIDVHGPASFENAAKISTMFRSGYAVDFFAASYPAIAPLYQSDPRQMPFTNAEQQYESRYIIDLALQVNLSAVTVTQSATTLSLDVISAETDPTGWPNATITVP